MSSHVELMCGSEGGCVSLTEVQTCVAYLRHLIHLQT